MGVAGVQNTIRFLAPATANMLSWRIATIAIIAAFCGKYLQRVLLKRKRQSAYLWPPIVTIEDNEMFNNPRSAYEKALKEFGPVIGVKRKGRLEYIVNNTFAKNVLTADAQFSFEEGTATILNIHFFSRFFGTFFTDMDKLVRAGVTSRMDIILEQILPVFARRAKELRADNNGEVCDLFHHVHEWIAEAMIIVIFGQAYVSKQSMDIITTLAHDIAIVTGIYQNTSIFARNFPTLWKSITWIRIICTTITRFFVIFGYKVWRDLRYGVAQCKNDAKSDSILSSIMVARDSEDKPSMKASDFVWIMSLFLGLVFASVHQTASVAVWIIFELALRPDYQDRLRIELDEHFKSLEEFDGARCSEMLESATQLDSFIREVLRTKGDTLSTCRRSTVDVTVDGITIPKGHLVIPLATLSHFSKEHYGEDAEDFNPERWRDNEGNVTRSITGSEFYFPFGLGRWACPGRYLAVAEIKLIVCAIISGANIRLRNDEYTVVDKLNITSVPPEGVLLLSDFGAPSGVL